MSVMQALCHRTAVVAVFTLAQRTGTRFKIGAAGWNASPPTPVSGGVFLNSSAGGLSDAAHSNTSRCGTLRFEQPVDELASSLC